jgi:hypothetical protein
LLGRGETLRFMKLNCKKEIAIWETCWESFRSLPILVQTSAMQVWSRAWMELVCKVVVYHWATKLHADALWRCSSSSWGSLCASSPWMWNHECFEIAVRTPIPYYKLKMIDSKQWAPNGEHAQSLSFTLVI